MIGDERWEGLPERTREQRRAEGPALLAELRSIRQQLARWCNILYVYIYSLGYIC